MGSVINLHIEFQTHNILSEAYIVKNTALIYSTIVSVDYALTPKNNTDCSGYLCGWKPSQQNAV